MLYADYMSITLGKINFRDIVREEGGGGRGGGQGQREGIFIFSVWSYFEPAFMAGSPAFSLLCPSLAA